MTCLGPKDRVRWYALFELQRLAREEERETSDDDAKLRVHRGVQGVE